MTESELLTLTGRLPEVFAGRISESELAGLRSMSGGGEWGELLDLLLAILLQTRAPVTVDERNQLRAVLEGWGLPTSQLDDLVIQP